MDLGSGKVTWPMSTLGDVAEPGRSIVSGPFGSNIGSRFFVAEGVPVIRGNNLTTDLVRFVDDGFVFLTEEKALEFRNCEAVPGDLVITAAGSLGQVGIIPERSKHARYIISNKQMRAHLNRTRMDPLFAYYWLASPTMVAYIQQRNTGSSVPLINLGVLKSLPIPVPPQTVQKAILDVLCALDEKIELNRRMNQTLEAMARALFKSWFVDFEPAVAKLEGRPTGLPPDLDAFFPSEFEDSPFGEIPKGWTTGSLGDVAVNPKRSVSATAIEPNEPYVGLEHIDRRCLALNSWGCGSDVASQKSRFQEGELLFGKLRPYFRKVVIAPVSGICSTDILVVDAREPSLWAFVVMACSETSTIDFVTASSGGTRMPRTSWSELTRVPLVIPPGQVPQCSTKSRGQCLTRWPNPCSSRRA